MLKGRENTIKPSDSEYVCDEVDIMILIMYYNVQLLPIFCPFLAQTRVVGYEYRAWSAKNIADDTATYYSNNIHSWSMNTGKDGLSRVCSNIDGLILQHFLLNI